MTTQNIYLLLEGEFYDDGHIILIASESEALINEWVKTNRPHHIPPLNEWDHNLLAVSGPTSPRYENHTWLKVIPIPFISKTIWINQH